MNQEITFENLPAHVADLRAQINPLVTILENSTREQEDRFLNRKEAMQILRIQAFGTIMKLEKSGELNPKRVGNKLLYQESEVRKLAENR